jgi:asparagine synthase (glutamine-hydrolysing)
MLSGGLDSSLVAAIAAEDGHALPSYSAHFTDQGYDETPQAARVAELFSSGHQIVDISDEAVPDALCRYVAKLDEPIADPSLIAVAMVTAAARGRVKGLLTGDGADDLFAGYNFFRAVPALSLAARHAPRWLLEMTERLLARMPGGAKNLGVRAVLQMLTRGTRVGRRWQHAYCTSAFTPEQLRTILTPDAVTLATWPFGQSGETAASPVREAQFGMLRSFLQAQILPKIDRGSMANGVELRSPFLDQDVAEYALSLPLESLVHRSETKVILRKVAERWLPDEIRRRPKKGFRLPVARLLRGPARQLLLDTLSAGALRRDGIFEVAAVHALLDQHLKQGLDRSRQLWALLAFNSWHQTMNMHVGTSAEIRPSIAAGVS